jgi:hypothetical protein
MGNPGMTAKTREAIADELKKGTKYEEIARKLGVSMGSVSNVARGFLEEEVRLQRSKRSETETKRQYRDALAEIERLNKELDTFRSIEDRVKAFQPVVIEPKHGGKGEATAILCVGDWHFEETIQKAAVNGVNEYNLGVARNRASRLWASAASLVDMCRSRSHIDTVIVNVLGDLITGYIHDELMATNALTPSEAVVAVFEQLISGLEFLKKTTKATEIIVPCVCGNHGRFTKKRWAKAGPGMNFEWLLYSLMAKWFQACQDKVIRIVLPQGDMTYYTVYNRTIRITHGDNLNYQGGIGGVHIPLRKALDVWNTQIRADYNYLGHWHSDLTGEDYRMTGSMIGYSEWSIRIKARFQKPSQAFEIQHPRFGATARFPIILE